MEKNETIITRTLEWQLEELNKDIPRSAVMLRDGGGGRKLSYLSGVYVINRLNYIFGPFGWAYDIKTQNVVWDGEITRRNGKAHGLKYISIVRMVFEFANGQKTEFTDVGYGDGAELEPGKGNELAAKESVTDAIKRCAKNLGMSMGLALYDKEQTNVSDEQPVTATTSSAPSAAAPTVLVAKALKAEAGEAGQPIISVQGTTLGALAPTALKETILRQANVLAKLYPDTQPLSKTITDMQAMYGVQSRDQLTTTQAEAFLSYLKEVGKKWITTATIGADSNPATTRAIRRRKRKRQRTARIHVRQRAHNGNTHRIPATATLTII